MLKKLLPATIQASSSSIPGRSGTIQVVPLAVQARNHGSRTPWSAHGTRATEPIAACWPRLSAAMRRFFSINSITRVVIVLLRSFSKQRSPLRTFLPLNSLNSRKFLVVNSSRNWSRDNILLAPATARSGPCPNHGMTICPSADLVAVSTILSSRQLRLSLSVGRHHTVSFPGESTHAFQTICCCNCAFHLAGTSGRGNHYNGFKQAFRQSHRTKNHDQSHRHRWHLP